MNQIICLQHLLLNKEMIQRLTACGIYETWPSGALDTDLIQLS